jgi:predicted transcriptional regulator
MTSITLELDDRHSAVLEELSAEQGLSKAALLRQSLRLYQLVHIRAKDGQELAFVKNGQVVPMLMPSLLPLPPTKG